MAGALWASAGTSGSSTKVAAVNGSANGSQEGKEASLVLIIPRIPNHFSLPPEVLRIAAKLNGNAGSR